MKIKSLVVLCIAALYSVQSHAMHPGGTCTTTYGGGSSGGGGYPSQSQQERDIAWRNWNEAQKQATLARIREETRILNEKAAKDEAKIEVLKQQRQEQKQREEIRKKQRDDELNKARAETKRAEEQLEKVWSHAESEEKKLKANAFKYDIYVHQNNRDAQDYIVKKINSWDTISRGSNKELAAAQVVNYHSISTEFYNTSSPLNTGAFEVSQAIFNTSVQTTLSTLVYQADIDSPLFEETLAQSQVEWTAAKAFLDLALDAVPIIGNAKVAYEGFTGKSLIDGHELTPTEQALSMLAALPGLGTAKAVVGTIKGIEKVYKHIENKLGKLSKNEIIIEPDYTKISIKIPDHHAAPGELPYVTQEIIPELIAARKPIENGEKVYRVGKNGISEKHPNAQYWSTENPVDANGKIIPDYAVKYGIPADRIASADFVEVCTVKPGATFATRNSVPYGGSAGGAIEVVVPANSTVKVEEIKLK